ncbi:hypothetical protein OPV22_015844 [Ensete ventricosum]|uniref:BEACH domain-containing protein n=1 Tax=Ensete ventricosum TaxID=4639 RepID=A0AAV8PMX4_ENSVE|nr:hypothetical protein OPV22_015844 [Ensete ventricosum]
MFQSSRKTMKWSSLRKDLRQKVGLSGSQPQPASYLYPSLSPAAEHGGAGAPESATAFGDGSPVSAPARGKHKLELDFKKSWVEFRSFSSEKRSAAPNLAVDIIKYLLLHRRSALEDLLVSKPNQGPTLDVLRGGLDKLLTGSPSSFFYWLQSSEQPINKVLEQCSSIMWLQYVAGSAKFPGVRIKGMEGRRKGQISRKAQEAAKLDIKHWEQIYKQRYALESGQDLMSTELRSIRQDKYGWVLHAESEWQTQLQQLVHERGIFPILHPSVEPEWQLCPIEGPYRMRKNLECCELKIDTIRNILTRGFMLKNPKVIKEKHENGAHTSESDSYFNLSSNDAQEKGYYDGGDHEESLIKEESSKIESLSTAQIGWNNGHGSMHEPSVHSAMEFGIKSSSISVQIAEGTKSELGPPRQSSFEVDDMRASEDKQEKELLDNGEYLIRPYLEPSEKIRFRYNCEHVMGPDKHDGIFLLAKSLINMEHNSRHLLVEEHGHMMELRSVAIEIFSMDGCNDLLVFHNKEREEVFKNLIAMNLPRNSMLDTTISGSSKQEGNEGSRIFKVMAKSFSKRWQNGEISNFQYLMHLNTLAGRGYSDLTQYPVFPWVLADYESETLDLKSPQSFRQFDKPMGSQTAEREDEFRKRYETWDDPNVPKFHYGSHYSSAGIVLFYLVRLPPLSTENQKLQGGQFDHADSLFNSVKDTWLSAAGKSNTSDVKEMIPEFFYMPEFLENRFNLDLGIKQSGENVGDVVLPPWAKGSAREFIRKHREALESDYVSENLQCWIDLIFGYKQRGKIFTSQWRKIWFEIMHTMYPVTRCDKKFLAQGKCVVPNWLYVLSFMKTYSNVSDPTMKASILAQINHFGQTPKQLFLKPHIKRRTDRKIPPHPLRYSTNLMPQQVCQSSSSISQIVTFTEKIFIAKENSLLKPLTYNKYISSGFLDINLRIMSHDQDKLLSTHENLHGGNQIQCVGVSHDGQFLVTGADDGIVAVWGFDKNNRLSLMSTGKITCLHVSQVYSLIVTGSEDCSVILWDLTNPVFVKQLPLFPALSAVHVNELTGIVMTAAGIMLAVWIINGDCLAVVNTSQLPSDLILSVMSPMHCDWQDTNWYERVTNQWSGKAGFKWEVTGVQVDHAQSAQIPQALHLSSDLKQLLSGDSRGHLLSWILLDNSLRAS